MTGIESMGSSAPRIDSRYDLKFTRSPRRPPRRHPLSLTYNALSPSSPAIQAPKDSCARPGRSSHTAARARKCTLGRGSSPTGSSEAGRRTCFPACSSTRRRSAMARPVRPVARS
jgi:hypothetical protein